VFGSKLMCNQLRELHALAGELPEYRGLEIAELLQALFGQPVYVWVSRRDKVRQAVSMWRALQSRRWRHEEDGQGGPRPTPVYRFAGVEHLVGLFEAEDRAWEEFFTRHGVHALRIVYEDDLDHDPGRAVASVLQRLGVTAPEGWHAPEPMARQSDSVSEEWIAAYQRDRGERRTTSGLPRSSAS
jgi:LPS sulfotransferase NodH